MPIIRRQRWQTVRHTSLVALWTWLARLPCRLHFVAYRWSLRIDAAASSHTNGAFQRHATRLIGLRTAHDQAMRIEPFCKLRRHRAAHGGLGLHPVKGDTETGATGAAMLARMNHGKSNGCVPSRTGAAILATPRLNLIPVHQTYCTAEYPRSAALP